MEKKTPLYDTHVKEGGKIVPFAGYLLPVQYATGVIAEHNAVRTKAGLFDVSHMGEIVFTGETALATLNHLLTNDLSGMAIGRIRYSPMCYENGTTVDDMIVYKFGEESYLAVVNASNKDKDFEHMVKNALPGTKVEDISDTVSQIALQGPKSKEILAKVVKEEDIPAKYYSATRECELAGMKCMISRTGYTGELGYEIYAAAADGPAIWEELRKAGEEFGCIPCGLGARDTLRMEAAMPLYGHEMDETITPVECGLDFAIKMKKEEFIGKEALEKAGKPSRVRVGLSVTGRGIIREKQPVFVGDKQIGMTTSGTHCPYVDHAIGMALVAPEYTELGTAVEVEVRGRRVAAEVVALPFYTAQ